MVNQQELEICRRRGHDVRPGEQWSQCKWCGLWLWSKQTIEEREDEPPEQEQDPLQRLSRDAERRRKKRDESS